VQRKRFGEISNIESVFLVFESIFNLEIEPLLVTLRVSVHIQVQIILSWCYVLSSFQVSALEKRIE